MARKAVVKLRKAERIEPPYFEKTPKSGSQLQGLAYERRVYEYLESLLQDHEVLHGPWFRYYDKFTGQRGSIAQPDIIVVPPDPALPLSLIECKLCYKPEADQKLARLYKPLVQYVYPGRRILTAQVFKSVPLACNLVLDARLKDLYNQLDVNHRDILEVL